MGRRPLLLVGTAGIAISLLVCAYGFNKATYQLTSEKINQLEFKESQQLLPFIDTVYDSDIAFKKDLKEALGNKVYSKNDGAILEVATSINATLILIGILGFIACFAFSLGPVMWVLLSELYPLKYRGLAIGVIAFVNSLISSLVQLVFPWELATLGNSLTFFIFGMIFLSALPWLPFSSEFIFGPAEEMRLYDNSIRTLDIFSELSSTLSLPDLKGLEFNQTNDLIRITTNEGFIFDKELKNKIEAFCEASACSVEFWETGIIVRKEK